MASGSCNGFGLVCAKPYLPGSPPPRVRSRADNGAGAALVVRASMTLPAAPHRHGGRTARGAPLPGRAPVGVALPGRTARGAPLPGRAPPGPRRPGSARSHPATNAPPVILVTLDNRNIKLLKDAEKELLRRY